MNKKEIAEIKKQYKPEYSCLEKIAGCYVDKDKNKVLSFITCLLLSCRKRNCLGI